MKGRRQAWIFNADLTNRSSTRNAPWVTNEVFVILPSATGTFEPSSASAPSPSRRSRADRPDTGPVQNPGELSIRRQAAILTEISKSGPSQLIPAQSPIKQGRFLGRLFHCAGQLSRRGCEEGKVMKIGGFGPGVFQNFNSATDQPVNSLAISAQPGQTVILWGTGLGPVTFADNIAPTPGSLPTAVEVFVGGKSATVSYSGRSPCCSGTDQIVFTVPLNAPAGCWVPVQVRTAGTILSNSTTMAISAAAGSPCAETNNPFAMKFVNGGKLGWLNLF